MTRLLALAALLTVTTLAAGWAAPQQPVPAPQPVDPGKMTWKKDYPKVIPPKPGEAEGWVELFGEVTAKPGWTVLEKAKFSYFPVTGGKQESHDLVVRDGKWGVLDPKDKTKLVPARFPIKKGKFHLHPTVTFEGRDATGQQRTLTVSPPAKEAEVKEIPPDL